MKKVVITNPTFNPSTKTVETNIENFDIRKLYAIINQTTGNLIYATGVQGKGFTGVNGSTINLQFDTTSMSSTDVLQFLYDDDEDTQWLQNIYEAVDALNFLTGVRGPAANLRVTVTDGAIAISSGTISTVNNIAAIGAYSANSQIPANINVAAVQSNINNINVTIS